MPITLDAIDRRILNVLQKDGRVNNNELARRVGLSPSPCLRRVKLLEEAGVISRYAAVLDPAKVDGGMMMFFVRVWLQAQDEDTVKRFSAAIQVLPQVVECHLVLGDCDALLKVMAQDIEGYRRFQSHSLGRVAEIQSMKTDVPTEAVKHNLGLPL